MESVGLILLGQIDLRLPPWEKPKPSNFPKKDPMAVLLPLYDAYAGPARRLNLRDTRMNPILKPIEDLPSRILLIVPTFDVLVHEQVSFIERVQADITNAGKEDRRTADAVLVDDAFHGWFERESSNMVKFRFNIRADAAAQCRTYPPTCERKSSRLTT